MRLRKGIQTASVVERRHRVTRSIYANEFRMELLLLATTQYCLITVGQLKIQTTPGYTSTHHTSSNTHPFGQIICILPRHPKYLSHPRGMHGFFFVVHCRLASVVRGPRGGLYWVVRCCLLRCVHTVCECVYVFFLLCLRLCMCQSACRSTFVYLLACYYCCCYVVADDVVVDANIILCLFLNIWGNHV